MAVDAHRAKIFPVADVVKFDSTHELVGVGGHVHDSGGSAFAQAVEEESGEEKIAEVVNRPDRFDAVLGLGIAPVDEPRVVHEQVDAVEGVQHLGGGGPYLGLGAEVGLEQLQVFVAGFGTDLLERLLALGRVAAQDSHPGALGGEGERGGLPDPRGGAGHDAVLAFEIHGQQSMAWARPREKPPPGCGLAVPAGPTLWGAFRLIR